MHPCITTKIFALLKFIVNFVDICCIALIWDTAFPLFTKKFNYSTKKGSLVTCYHTNAEMKTHISKRKLGNEKDLFTRNNSNDISEIVVKKLYVV